MSASTNGFKAIFEKVKKMFQMPKQAQSARPHMPSAQARQETVLHVVEMEVKTTAATKEEPEGRIAAFARLCRQKARDIAFKLLPGEPVEAAKEALRQGATADALAMSRSEEEYAFCEKQLLDQLAPLGAELKIRQASAMTAHANIRTIREELALHPETRYPTASAVLRWGAVAGITLSLASVVHDSFPGLHQALRWIIAVGFSGMIGMLICAAILPDDEPSLDAPNEAATNLQGYAVKAGIMLGVAFLIVRLTMARTLPDVMLICGGTMIEVAIVLFLERKAKELEARIASWRKNETFRRRLEGTLEAAVKEGEYRDGLVNEILAKQSRIERERKENVALRNEKRLIDIGTSASDCGFEEGLAKRREHDLGGAYIHPEHKASDSQEGGLAA